MGNGLLQAGGTQWLDQVAVSTHAEGPLLLWYSSSSSITSTVFTRCVLAIKICYLVWGLVFVLSAIDAYNDFPLI